MTKDKKESESLEKVHRDLVSDRPSSLVKRAIADLARLKAHPPSGPEQSRQIDLLKKRQIRVVIGNHNENLKDLFLSWITDVIKDKYALTIKWVSYGEELIEFAENDDVDIFIVIVNNIRFRPSYPPKSRIEKSVQLITKIKRVFNKPMIVFYEAFSEDQVSEESVKQAGADFYFPLSDGFPFQSSDDDDFKIAFEKCIYEVLRRAR